MSEIAHRAKAATHSSQGLRLARLSTRNPHLKVQLVCFPPNGGGFFTFQPWVRPSASLQPLLPAEIGLWGAQFPWTAPWTYRALACALTDALEEQRLPVPLVLCGASLGALLAWGVALELQRRQAERCLGLAVMAMRAPQCYQPDPARKDWTDDQWHAKLQEDGMPREVLTNPAQFGRLLARLRGGNAILDSFTYRQAPASSLPMAAFLGENDRECQEMESWWLQTTGPFTLHLYPEAGHLDLLQAPPIRACVVADLVADIQAWRRQQV